MNKGRRDQQRRKEHPSLRQTGSVDGSDWARFSADAMRRRVDAIIRAQRERRLKRREEGRFAFLKRALGSPSLKSDASTGTAKRNPQAEHSNIRSREARALQTAESLDICARVEQTVSDFIRRASTGDRTMVSKLNSIAVEIIAALNFIALKRPEVVLPISRKSFFWPALIGRKRAFKQGNERLMKLIQLGSGNRFSTRGWQVSAPSTQAAIDLFLTAHDFQGDWNLPPLTTQNKKKWFEVAWQQMLNDGIEPEKIPWLAPVGKSAVGKRSISRGMSEQTEGMKRDDMRAEIKRQVWNSFEKLVVGQSKKSK